MTGELLLADLARMLTVDSGSLAGSDRLADFAGWDSLQALAFITGHSRRNRVLLKGPSSTA